jgi:hypothetical protein
MPKSKISATVSPDLLRRAQELTGNTNVSSLLDAALESLVQLELERQWLAAGPPEPVEATVDLSHIPWED